MFLKIKNTYAEVCIRDGCYLMIQYTSANYFWNEYNKLQGRIYFLEQKLHFIAHMLLLIAIVIYCTLNNIDSGENYAIRQFRYVSRILIYVRPER